MVLNPIPKEVVDWRDIRVHPHDRRARGYARKPDSHMEHMFGYQIIRSTRPEIYTDGRELVSIVEPGDWIAQPRWCYGAPEVFKTYPELQKRFYIPRDSRETLAEDLEYYGLEHQDLKQKYVDRWNAEAERAKAPRKRFRKIRLDEEDM